jgi:hypothetical protein
MADLIATVHGINIEFALTYDSEDGVWIAESQTNGFGISTDAADLDTLMQRLAARIASILEVRGEKVLSVPMHLDRIVTIEPAAA